MIIDEAQRARYKQTETCSPNANENGKKRIKVAVQNAYITYTEKTRARIYYGHTHLEAYVLSRAFARCRTTNRKRSTTELPHREREV